MSGYGGRPPAWNDPNDPYGQAQGWNDPGGYGAPSPHGYGYGPPGVTQQQSGSTPGSTIAALICTSVATAMCCNVLAIPGIVTSAMAMNRSRTDPASARSLTIWSWVILGVAMVLQILLFVILVIVDIQSGPDYYDEGV